MIKLFNLELHTFDSSDLISSNYKYLKRIQIQDELNYLIIHIFSVRTFRTIILLKRWKSANVKEMYFIRSTVRIDIIELTKQMENYNYV